MPLCLGRCLGTSQDLVQNDLNTAISMGAPTNTDHRGDGRESFCLTPGIASWLAARTTFSFQFSRHSLLYYSANCLKTASRPSPRTIDVPTSVACSLAAHWGFFTLSYAPPPTTAAPRVSPNFTWRVFASSFVSARRKS